VSPTAFSAGGESRNVCTDVRHRGANVAVSLCKQIEYTSRKDGPIKMYSFRFVCLSLQSGERDRAWRCVVAHLNRNREAGVKKVGGVSPSTGTT